MVTLKGLVGVALDFPANTRKVHGVLNNTRKEVEVQVEPKARQGKRTQSR